MAPVSGARGLRVFPVECLDQGLYRRVARHGPEQGRSSERGTEGRESQCERPTDEDQGSSQPLGDDRRDRAVVQDVGAALRGRVGVDRDVDDGRTSGMPKMEATASNVDLRM